MRKGMMAIDEIIKIAAVLVGAVALFMLVNYLILDKGKSYEKSANDIFDAGWEFGCTEIKEPVDFKTFMETMYSVYNDCNDASKNICGAKSCKSMTLKLKEGAGTYYQINHNVLKSWDLDVYNRVFCIN